jgi:agmatinase
MRPQKMAEASQMRARVDRPFVGIPSFLRSRICSDLAELDADIAVVGVPTDEGSPFMPGSRFGSRSIREQSLRFLGSSGIYDPQSGKTYLEPEIAQSRIVDTGDVDVLPTNVVATFRNITDHIAGVVRRNALPLVLGGDHSISFPVIRAFPRPIFVVQLDAHLDYAPVSDGLEFTNGHPFRHVMQLDTVRGLMQIGIRSLRSSSEMMADAEQDGSIIATMRQFRETPLRTLIERLPGDAQCYVSIDVDVLDPPLVPGCVSAEPDGMSYPELRSTLTALAEWVDVVGFDIVEVNPQLDVGTQATSYLAAHTAIEFLGNICLQPRWIAHHGRG